MRAILAILAYAALYLAVLLALAAPSHAQQQMNCAPAASVDLTLSAAYPDLERTLLVAQSGEAMILYNSPATTEWVLLLLTQNGLACGVISGAGFQPIKPGEPG